MDRENVHDGTVKQSKQLMQSVLWKPIALYDILLYKHDFIESIWIIFVYLSYYK